VEEEMDLEETNKKLEKQVELLTTVIELYEKYRDLLEECEKYNKGTIQHTPYPIDPLTPYLWWPNTDPIIY